MRKWILLMLGGVGLCLGLSRALGQEETIPYEKYAQELVDRLELDGLLRKPEALRVVLEEGYLNMRLGGFDVWYPRSVMSDKNGFHDFKDVLQALLEMQGQWIQWFTEGRDVPCCDKEQALLKKWMRTISARKCMHAGTSEFGPPEITVLLDAPEKVQNAESAFCRYMKSLDYMDNVKRPADPVKIVFLPTRKEYLLLGCFLSTLSKDHALFFQVPGFPYWTSYSWADMTFIALETTASGPGHGDVTEGLRMDMKSKTGMLQHVVYLAMQRLITACLGHRLPRNIADGLAMNMVIELYDENDVQMGGGRNTRGSAPPSRFYLGSTNPSRAKLESLWYVTRWRKNKGADHFLKPLRYAQEKGSKEARKRLRNPDRPNAFFLLEPDDSQAGSYLIEAPFLEGFGPKKEIPNRFKNDYLEFHRAYRSAFTYWLKREAESDVLKLKPERLFQKALLRIAAISSASVQSESDRIFNDLYGKPLCGGDAAGHCLENDFLDWLADG